MSSSRIQRDLSKRCIEHASRSRLLLPASTFPYHAAAEPERVSLSLRSLIWLLILQQENSLF
jgi:hypothetical protein